MSNLENLKVPENCNIAGYTSIKPEGKFFQFYDSKGNELRCRSRIRLNLNVMSQSTIVHELLHFLTHPNFSSEASSALTEGVTEYFTRKVQNQVFNYVEEKHSNEPIKEQESSAQKKGGKRNFNLGQDEMKSLNEMKGFTNDRTVTSAYNIAHDKTIESKKLIRNMLASTASYKAEGLNKLLNPNPHKKELKKNLGKLDQLDQEIKDLLNAPENSTKHILRRAYFLGDRAMIRLLINYANVTFK